MSRAKDVPKNAGKLLSINGLIKAGDIITAKRSWMNEPSSKVIDWQPAREVEGSVIFYFFKWKMADHPGKILLRELFCMGYFKG